MKPKPFKERSQEFRERLNALLKQYGVKFQISLIPDNFLSKIFRKVIRVKWGLNIVDGLSKE